MAGSSEKIGAAGFYEIDHLCFEVGVVEAIDFLHAGWAGDVHLGQVVADYIQADEIEAVLFQARPQRRADFAIAIGHGGLHAGAADVDVAAMLVVARDAQGASQWLALQHDKALVAIADLRDIALGHDWFGFEAGRGFQNCAEVAILRKALASGRQFLFVTVITRCDEQNSSRERV